MSKRVKQPCSSNLQESFALLPSYRLALAWASVGGSISGTVKDPSGRVVPDAEVTVRETEHGALLPDAYRQQGHYTFPVLPVGHYELKVQASGFSGYQRKDVVLDTNAALTLDASLEVGGVAQTVSVVDNTLARGDQRAPKWAR